MKEGVFTFVMTITWMIVHGSIFQEEIPFFIWLMGMVAIFGIAERLFIEMEVALGMMKDKEDE